MSKWQEIRFEDLYEIPSRNGLTRPSSVRGEGYNFINMGELFTNNRIYDMETELVKLNEKEKKDSTLIEGDLLFARQSLVYEGAGKCSIVMNLNNITSFESHLIRVRLNKSTSEPLFYYYYFSLPYNAVKTIVQQCAQAGIRGTDLSKIRVPYPDLPTQKRIADVLSAYDELIENNNKRIALLEKAAQELYKEWFVRFRFPSHEKAKFVNGLPEGWSYVKLGGYANISTGKCNREDAEDEGIYPLFDRSQEIKKSNVWIKDCEAIIVPGEGTSFIPRYFHGKFNLHQRCYCVEPKLSKTGKFLYQTLMLNRIYFLYVATGATVPSLRQNNFTGMKILMPEMRLVNKFDDVVSSFMNEINSLSERNKNLIKQRDLLLPRLMSGKLEV